MIIPIIQYNDGETIGHMEYNQYIAPLLCFYVTTFKEGDSCGFSKQETWSKERQRMKNMWEQ